MFGIQSRSNLMSGYIILQYVNLKQNFIQKASNGSPYDERFWHGTSAVQHRSVKRMFFRASSRLCHEKSEKTLYCICFKSFKIQLIQTQKREREWEREWNVEIWCWENERENGLVRLFGSDLFGRQRFHLEILCIKIMPSAVSRKHLIDLTSSVSKDPRWRGLKPIFLNYRPHLFVPLVHYSPISPNHPSFSDWSSFSQWWTRHVLCGHSSCLQRGPDAGGKKFADNNQARWDCASSEAVTDGWMKRLIAEMAIIFEFVFTICKVCWVNRKNAHPVCHHHNFHHRISHHHYSHHRDFPPSLLPSSGFPTIITSITRLCHIFDLTNFDSF